MGDDIHLLFFYARAEVSNREITVNPVDNETIHKQLNWRYACKKFDPAKKVREADWNILAESLRLSASSYGLQPWKFIVVQNPELRNQLLPLSWGQTPVTEASHFVVLAYKEKMDEAHIDRFLDQNVKVRGIDPASLAGYKNMMMGDLVNGPRSATINWWAERQVYIAM
jgi:nitroreductase